MIVRLAKKEDARQIAEIHKQEISEGFLSSLPLQFLIKLYEEIIVSKLGFCIIARENGNVIGFVAGTTNLNAFYRYFISHSFFRAMFILFPQIFSFKSLKKIIESLIYPAKEKELPSAELLTIAVKKEFQGQHIAGDMLQLFIEEMKNSGVSIFKVLVGKELKSAIRFYEKTGFQYFSEVSVHSNQKSLIYVYHIQ